MRNGKGVLYWPSGARYEGLWANDEMKGGGIFYSNDGKESFSPATLEEAFTILWREMSEKTADAVHSSRYPLISRNVHGS